MGSLVLADNFGIYMAWIAAAWLGDIIKMESYRMI